LPQGVRNHTIFENDDQPETRSGTALMSRINGDVLRSRYGRGIRACRPCSSPTGRGAQQKGIRLLVRPFTIGQLAARVRETLDAPVSRMRAGY
jgi:hypothetical protein